ncbi:MAG: phosphomannomutase/phosphoglucomutase [Christensenellaceae bacterium]|nr:phosphomannomutase/phosphoglucomutase [Christensenellaceae bacterium]
MIDYKKLQNGSDIRGVAIEVDGGKPVDLTSESVTRIGSAFALWVSKRLNKPISEIRIAVGRDSRLSGEKLTEWFIDGLTSVGASAFDGGMSSTPAMFMCCVNELSFDAGVMITASHLPMERNGLKFFVSTGNDEHCEKSNRYATGLEKADIASILSSAETGDFAGEAMKDKRVVDIMTPYIDGLKKKILDGLGCVDGDTPLSGLRIVVDAGNGAGGFFAERLLAPLGADITGSIYLEPDGNFPNHQPNPENAQAMECICEAVRSNKADLGIIFDTDVDRAGAVIPMDGDAFALDRNRLIAMMSAILSKQYGSITVVTDSITSTGLTKFIDSLGCRHHRFKRGYRNVINEAQRLMANGENAIFAMETSGHGALAENYFLDDGAYIIVKLLIELVRAKRADSSLSDLISTLNEPVESAEARLAVNIDNYSDYTENVLAHVEKHFAGKAGFTIVQPNFEGVRVNADAAHGDGWFLIRRSLHDPIMPCNLESNSEGGLKALSNALYECISAFDKLNKEPLCRLM